MVICPANWPCRNLSLSWLGPCEIKGLRLDDPEGREVIQVNDIALAAGIWRLATSAFRFEKLSIDSPRVALYLDEHQQISLLRAVGAGEKSAAKEKPSSLPELTGNLAVHHGAIKVVRADGRQLEISRIDGDFSIEAMSTHRGQDCCSGQRGGNGGRGNRHPATGSRRPTSTHGGERQGASLDACRSHSRGPGEVRVQPGERGWDCQLPDGR